MEQGTEIDQEKAAKKKQAYRRWYLKNKAKRSAYNCAWAKAHKQSVNAKKRKWCSKNRKSVVLQNTRWNAKNPEKMREYASLYRSRHPERVKLSFKKYIKTPRARVIRSARKRVHEFVKLKLGVSSDLFGTTPEGLRKHIESRFKDGMTWDNYGQWHIDHIRPLSSFDLNDRKQALEASHWSNLQPLWAKENLIKNAKWYPTQTTKQV